MKRTNDSADKPDRINDPCAPNDSSARPSDVNTAKVGFIKMLLKVGAYKVDSAAVANRMLSSIRHRLSTASR
ncbi:flagellar biosynthesis anti-sigma factor FlgM [Caballeronia sp. AZ10_KS36]|uniref:flagellar biosynthesis anti-sigma factor FlgM n=1 Tax=Caballeronia sp. AZ10_KS36 TaxID=2921757 RepID=UPI0032ECC738